MNHVDYLSVSYCYDTNYKHNPISMFNGNQSVENTNISMNYAEFGSGISIFSPSSFKSSHCTYSHNNSTRGFCLSFSSILME